MSLLLVLACGPLSQPVPLVEPGGSASPAPGEAGPYGAARVRARAQARVTDAIDLDIVYPSDTTGLPDVSDTPVVVFVHGGLVPAERYHWLPVHLATRGWTTVLPHADLQLAITEPGNGSLALDRLHQLAEAGGPLDGLVGTRQPVVAMGHSLGGVMAAGQWATDEDVDALVWLASFSADFQPMEQGTGPVLALTGTTDVFEWETLEAQLDRVSGPTLDARIDGMNHYAWTDDATERELASDGPQTRPVAETRADALQILDRWLDVELFGADPALLDGPFDDVELR